MSKNPNVKCRYCGTEKNVIEEAHGKDFSWSIMTCVDCLHKLPNTKEDFRFTIKTRIINYIKRLVLRL